MAEAMTILPFYGEGELKKRGGIGGRSLQSRWFELRGQQLVYYSEEPRGVIDLSENVVIQEEPDGESWTMTAPHLSHPYTISAASAVERAHWLRMIHKSLKGPQEGYLDGKFVTLELEREALIATTEQLGKEIHQKTNKVQELTDTLADTTGTLVDTSSQLLAARQKITELQHSLETQQKDAAADASRLREEHNTAVRELSNEVATHLNTDKAQKAEISELKSSLTDSIATVKKLTTELEDANQRTVHLTRDFERQKEDLSAKLLTQSSEAIHERQRVESTFGATIQHLEEVVKRQQNGLEENERREHEGESKLAGSTAALRRTQIHIDDLRAKVAEHEATNTRLRASLTACRQRETALGKLTVTRENPEEEYINGTLHTVVGVQGAIIREGEETASPFICRFPQGASVFVAETVGRRAHVIEPVEGWVSTETANGAVIIAPSPDFEEPDTTEPLEVGDCVMYSVVKQSKVAGQVAGLIQEVTNEGKDYKVCLRRCGVVDALGLGEMCVVRRMYLTKAVHQWVIFDHADEQRTASTSAHKHPSGYGCHKGRLASDFAWFAEESDKSPWYEVDMQSVQPVGGVVVGGYFVQKTAMQYHVSQFKIQYRTELSEEWRAVPDTFHAEDANIDVFSFTPEGTDITVADEAHLPLMNVTPIIARYVRIIPTEWTGLAACMKVGIVVSKWHYPEDNYQRDDKTAERNAWTNHGKREAYLIGMDDKIQALRVLTDTVERSSGELERERAEFVAERKLLQEANLGLTENVRSLQDKGELMTKRTVLLRSEEELKEIQCSGVRVSQAPEGSKFAAGMRILEVNGCPVELGEEILEHAREWAEGAAGGAEQSDGLPVLVSQYKTSAYVNCLREELEALRAEIRRQHSLINTLESARDRVRTRSNAGHQETTHTPLTQTSSVCGFFVYLFWTATKHREA